MPEEDRGQLRIPLVGVGTALGNVIGNAMGTAKGNALGIAMGNRR